MDIVNFTNLSKQCEPSFAVKGPLSNKLPLIKTKTTIDYLNKWSGNESVVRRSHHVLFNQHRLKIEKSIWDIIKSKNILPFISLDNIIKTEILCSPELAEEYSDVRLFTKDELGVGQSWNNEISTHEIIIAFNPSEICFDLISLTFDVTRDSERTYLELCSEIRLLIGNVELYEYTA